MKYLCHELAYAKQEFIISNITDNLLDQGSLRAKYQILYLVDDVVNASEFLMCPGISIYVKPYAKAEAKTGIIQSGCQQAFFQLIG